MIFVRSSCIAWNHNGNKGIQYRSQWKSSLRKFYGRHHHLVYPCEIYMHKIIIIPCVLRRFCLSSFTDNNFYRRNCLPFENTWVHSSPAFDHIRIAPLFVCSCLVHQCYLCLVSSPAPQFMIKSVLFIFLVCSWIAHQCCLCL